jgi:glycine/D-amino acid oxidase-like deaminating enzyme
VKNIDYIIAGQGIAGSLLAWFLLQRSQRVLVIDPEEVNTSSRISGGMIHPVTGRRIAKSWMADTLIPYARTTYTDIEDKLAGRFFEDYPVLEIFNDIQHRNDWAGRSADEGMDKYIKDECPPNAIPEGINAPYGGRWVVGGGWLDTKRFLDAIRQYLKGKNSYLNGTLDFYDAEKTESGIQWKEYSAKAIIDCTGMGLYKSDYGTDLPFNPCTGELLNINVEGLPKDFVVHGSIKIIPTGGNGYIGGATYDYTRRDGQCTVDGREKLESSIQKLISRPYSITQQLAAVRPSTTDRKPIIGKHFSNEKYYFFNGLGSKGVMMGPWHAMMLVKHLLEGTEIPEEYRPYRGKLVNWRIGIPSL